jgi:hypothetical protein
VKISKLPTKSLATKCHLDVAPCRGVENTIRGEGGGFPQVQAVVSFVNLSLLMAHLSTKNAQTMH